MELPEKSNQKILSKNTKVLIPKKFFDFLQICIKENKLSTIYLEHNYEMIKQINNKSLIKIKFIKDIVTDYIRCNLHISGYKYPCAKYKLDNNLQKLFKCYNINCVDIQKYIYKLISNEDNDNNKTEYDNEYDNENENDNNKDDNNEDDNENENDNNEDDNDENDNNNDNDNDNDNDKSTKLSIDNFEIPTDDIIISFIGGVSTGKSTVLNTFFCEQLTQTKIKRTTMVPTIYIENNNYNNVNIEEIYNIIENKNNEIIKKTEYGEIISNEEYNELIFNVGKLDIKILDDVGVKIYDIPGLNDAKTKNLYYEYLENNFHKLNIVIFIIDIQSGLNTSDEIDILNFITKNTKYQLDQNNKKIYTLVIVNKADDMQIQNDNLILTGELNEMYNQVEKTIKDEFEKNNIIDQLINIIPLCAIDAYLYKMVKKHKNNFKLSPEQILKIGINENGKKFSILSQNEQEEKVYTILNDDNFIDTMIKLSGFNNLEETLYKFCNNKNKDLRINNISFELNKYDDIITKFKYANSIYPSNIENTIKKFMNIYDIIKKIDYDIYDIFMKSIVAELLIILQNKITTLYTFDTINDLINDYNNLLENILKLYFSDYYDINDYPIFFKQYVYKLIRYFYIYNPTINQFITSIKYIKEINSFKSDIINNFIKFVMDIKYICFETDDNIDELIVELDNIKKFNDLIDIDIITFIRFLIIHQLELDINNNNHNLLFMKKMLYYKYKEIPIYNYLTLLVNKDFINDTVIINGLSDTNNIALKLDNYYLIN
jgi:hypothetical protein